MVPDILSKLDTELQQEITSERQIVYILVETRKLLEDLPETDGFETLDFYCNWAVHRQMDRASAKALVRRVDQHFAKLLGSGLNERENSWLRRGAQPRFLPHPISEISGGTFVAERSLV
jgi:hypothetical protein